MALTLLGASVPAQAAAGAVQPAPSPAGGLPDAPQQPPSHLQGEYDPETDTVRFTWQAPDGGAASYNVYRDGALLASVMEAAFAEAAPAAQLVVYAFTAVSDAGESLPVTMGVVDPAPFLNLLFAVIGKNPLALRSDDTGAPGMKRTEERLFTPEPCPPVGIGENSNPPFVAHIATDCLPV